MPYDGSFSAVDGFSFFGGNDFGGAVKPKYGVNFSAVMSYGDIVLSISGFSFFGGNVNGDSKLGGNYGA